MYRELASVGKVFGVRGGPYAGKVQVLSIARLAPSIRTRLESAIARSALPTPLLFLRPPMRSVKVPLAIAMVLVAPWAALQIASASFASPSNSSQSTATIVLYALCAFAWIQGIIALTELMRRTRLPDGLYLFPLDVVVISGDRMQVHPLGGLRKAVIRKDKNVITSLAWGKQAFMVLELTFENGHVYPFPCGQANVAQRAYAELEKAQEGLEHLTLGAPLEEAVRTDPFFELRHTDVWQAHAPKRMFGRASVQLGVAIMGAGAVGTGLFFARNVASDNAFYMQACSLNTRAAYNEYLQQSRSHRHDADANVHLGMLAKLAQDKVDTASNDASFAALLDHDRLSSVPDAHLGPAGKAAVARLLDDAQRNYTQRAGSAKFAPTVLEKLEARRKNGNGREMFDIQFALRPDGADRTPARACMIHALEPIELAVVEAFARTLHDVISPLLIQVRSLPTRYTGSATRGSTIGVDVVLRGSDILATEVSFHTWVTQGERVTRAFDLTMPAPHIIPPLRPSSLFAELVQQAPTTANDPRPDCIRVAARAFDRLYDELYGLFFVGPIRVPAEVTK